MILTRRNLFLSGVSSIMSPAFAQLSGDFSSDGSLTLAATATSGTSAWINGAEFELSDVVPPSIVGDPSGVEDDQFQVFAKRRLQEILDPGVSDMDVWRLDRWQRSVGRLVVGIDVDVQSKLVEEGVLIVRPRSDDADYIGELLLAEERARRDERGLWAFHDFAVCDGRKPLGRIARKIGRFALVEGYVERHVKVGSREYINFGDDYKTDVTGTIETRERRSWSHRGLGDAGEAIVDLTGRKVRVRGMVARINGPSIDVRHPCQIEVMGA